MVKQIWPIKYRPSKISDYIFQNDHQKNIIQKFIDEKSIPNLLLTGHQGIGKTTLALILKNELEIEDSDFLFLNASDENSVDTIRYKIKTFVGTMATGAFKLVLLDECDYITPSAQAILRNLMEEPDISGNARFILTANFPKKIMGPLRSRCQEFAFNKIDRDQILEKAAIILSKEKIKVGDIELLDRYVDLSYPDFRKLLVMLEQNSVGGILQEPVTVDTSVDYKLEIMDHLDKGNWQAIRTIVCNNVDGEEWAEVYKFMYEYIHEVGKFKDITKWKQAIIIIADHLYKNSICADSEINFVACVIRLTEI